MLGIPRGNSVCTSTLEKPCRRSQEKPSYRRFSCAFSNLQPDVSATVVDLLAAGTLLTAFSGAVFQSARESRVTHLWKTKQLQGLRMLMFGRDFEVNAKSRFKFDQK